MDYEKILNDLHKYEQKRSVDRKARDTSDRHDKRRKKRPPL